MSHRDAEHPDFNPDIDRLTGYRTQSMLTAALRRFGGEPIGVIQVLNAQHTFDERDLEVLEVLCAQAATCLETTRLFEEARKADVLRLVGDISHDIKNMLAPIKSGTYTLDTLVRDFARRMRAICCTCPPEESWGETIENVLNKAVEDFRMLFDVVLQAADRLESRTLQIADAVRTEISPMMFRETDMNEIAAQAACALRLTAKNAGVSLHLDLDPHLPLAQLDPRQMYSMLYNLLNNSIPETPVGGTVTIKTRAPDGKRQEILVEVEDTGRGMAKDILERAFTSTAVSTKSDGTGLGTRIVADVVKRHHGALSVQSEEGRGTRVSISLPLQPPRPL